MQWKTVHRELKRLSMKLWLQKLLKNSTEISFLGSLLTLIIVMVSHFKPILYLEQKVIYLWISLLILIAIKTLFNKPTLKEAAQCGDKLGFHERFITYLEFEKVENPIFETFKNDLEDELQDFDIVKGYKLSMSGKITTAIIISILISFGSYFIPTSSREISLEREGVNKDIKKEMLKIEKKEKDIVESLEDEELKKEALNILRNLNKSLNKSTDYEKALGEISKAEEKLKGLEAEKYKKDLKLMSKVFNGTSLENSSLSMELSKGSLQDSTLEENITMSKDDKDRILENLEDINEFKDNKSIKNQIENVVKKDEIKVRDIVNSMKKPNEDNIKINNELNKSRENLMAKKGQKDFENREGDKKSDDFALGEKKDTYKYGEDSNIKDTKETSKGEGMGKREDNNSLGSSKTGENNEIREKANKGTIGKDDNNIKNKDESSLTMVDSKVNEEGKLIDKGYGQVSGEKGDSKSMENTWVKYKSEAIDTILKSEIPMDKESLVIDYYNVLNN